MRCSACGATYIDDGRRLVCDRHHGPSMLVTEYRARRLVPDSTAAGLFRYRCWLPCARELAGAGTSVTFRSEGLARRLGLRNLWVAFNGWWPERGARLSTATFKELEAWTVLARLRPDHGDVLVVASAGNTAAAFAHACGLVGLRCLLVVPESGLGSLTLARSNPCVKVVALEAPADYADAIEVAGRVAALDGFLAEGGTLNVGRRDGLGTVLLRAAETMGTLPDLYFQAVGSGAGAIAVDEAARRLVGDGRFGKTRPRLVLSQNEPFAPMAAAWEQGQRELTPCPADDARERIARMAAPVLSNRQPVYSVAGGVFDAVVGTGGDVSSVSNEEVWAAQRLFQESEGTDIGPASGVALASLETSIYEGRVGRDELVLLNITGGGGQRRRREVRLAASPPALRLRADQTDAAGVADRVTRLFE